MWVDMGHWLLWGSVMRARRSPWNWSAGSAPDVAPAADGLGVDGVAVGGVEVDEAAGGRVLGRQGAGEHADGAGDFDLGMADAALGHGHADACVKWGW